MILIFKRRLAELYYGWWMVAVCCVIRVLGGGLHAYGFTVFFLPVTQELGLTRAATSLVFSLARAQGAIEGPLAGYCIDRYGPRPVITIAVLLAGIGYVMLAGVTSYAALLIVYMGVISLSYQAGFMDATMAVANTWFIRRRVLAMSFTSGSIALGGTLVTPILAYGVLTWGWRPAALGAGLVFLLGGLPLAFLIRRSPESMGLAPDGATSAISDGAPSPASTRETAPERDPSTRAMAKGHSLGIPPENRGVESGAPGLPGELHFSLRETLRMHQFWLLTLATTLRVICISAVLVHFVPILVWKGFTQQQAAFYLGFLAFFGMPIHLLIGWIGDRVSKPRLMASCMMIASASLFLLFFGTEKWQLWIALASLTVLEGLFSVTWATVGDFFGRNHFAKVRGAMSFLYTWGSVLGPVMAGAIYDSTQNYFHLSWVLVGLCWVTAILYIVLVAPQSRLSDG
ncbi:MAG: MFS transporter [Deltaproteobacteria bacterium]|nr:MFS transporter [Deltaproteobacteria bacterium]MBI2179332.1 MFS transporter [Deltaproteobacteria bacterium]MBI2229227.1 MFS transporter [Deltaproteobacteria bacterium]MBI2533890.1 MFS transporter [Deltaproteobacteria bacterium]MBI3066121.1 MFS transporter [Deltaproteobacteria bacterium]